MRQYHRPTESNHFLSQRLDEAVEGLVDERIRVRFETRVRMDVDHNARRIGSARLHEGLPHPRQGRRRPLLHLRVISRRARREGT